MLWRPIAMSQIATIAAAMTARLTGETATATPAPIAMHAGQQATDDPVARSGHRWSDASSGLAGAGRGAGCSSDSHRRTIGLPNCDQNPRGIFSMITARQPSFVMGSTFAIRIARR